MKNIKKIIIDVLYVSKLTNIKNKKRLIIVSVLLSQIVVFADVALIIIFSSLITNQVSDVESFSKYVEFILQNKILLFPIIGARYICNYFQNMILKKLEQKVWKNLRIYFMSEMLSRRSYSTGDAYFYINTLTMHIGYFYSNFANLANSLLQIVAYAAYLIIVDIQVVSIFGAGLLLIAFPIQKVLGKAKHALDMAFKNDLESNKELERIIDNFLLIKILKKENFEIQNYSNKLSSTVFFALKNHKYGIINSFIPTLFIFLTLSIIVVFTNLLRYITLDFLAITLRLFQSITLLTKSLTNVNNSHVHVEKISVLEKNKGILNTSNYAVNQKDTIQFNDVSFKYLNSQVSIFENVDLIFAKNQHTVITGPNGSGKSTLLGLIAGMFYSDSGMVTTFTSKMGYIGATPLIFEGTLRENILYGNDLDIEENLVLDQLRELETFKEDIHYDLELIISNKTLSSGQMQKVAFVRALVSNAEVLLLDEATSNLDQDSKEKVFELLSKNNITIINSTHIPESFTYDKRYHIKLINEKRSFEEID
jgi:ABC-type bacteriocin/lantibiotic exporter with double-glycine peptidase domain